MKVKYFYYLLLITLCLVAYQNCGAPFQASSVDQSELSSINEEVLSSDPNTINFLKSRGIFVKPKSKLRLLSGIEIKNTIYTLTGYTLEQKLNFADRSAGFNSGGLLSLDSNIFDIIYSVAEKSIAFYLQNNVLNEFSCFRQDFSQNCYDSIILGFAEKSYRRPVSTVESTELKKLFQDINSELGNTKDSIQLTLVRTLVSNQFLYRSEIGSSDGNMNNFEIASFISYSLTGDMPDIELYQLAKGNQLNSNSISGQVNRLLQTEKSKTWLTSFFKSWLRLDNLSDMIDDPDRFSKFQNKNMGSLLNQEFELFIDDVVFNRNGSTSDLLTHNKTFANKDTAYLYKKDITSTQMIEIGLSDERSGILTLASVMAAHSSDINKEKDQPVKRGLLIKNQLLCETVGLPTGLSLSEAEDTVRQNHPNYDSYTVRKQYEAGMNQSATCTTCHSQFMPFGYLSSNFNALGEFKVIQKDQTIISKASPRISQKNHTFLSITDMAPVLAKSKNYQHCFSEKLGTYLIGNASEVIDGNINWMIFDHHTESRGTIKSMIRTSLSDPRMYQRRRN